MCGQLPVASLSPATLDYLTTGFNSDLTFGATDASIDVTVPLNDDSVYELPEYFLGLLTTSDSGVTIFADTANATILDDDSNYLLSLCPAVTHTISFSNVKM